MSLRLRPPHLERIRAHLCRAYPEEGCGVLLGREQRGDRVVERVIAVENRRAEERGRRYHIAPEQVLAAERAARESGLEVLGFFHSHPDHPPHPSAVDLEHAWPYYSYLIVSVARGRAGEARAWRLAGDRTRFDPEPLEPASAAEPHEARAGRTRRG